jgi:bisphosphoglycerate-dependent phosphoglycerate mutase
LGDLAGGAGAGGKPFKVIGGDVHDLLDITDASNRAHAEGTVRLHSEWSLVRRRLYGVIMGKGDLLQLAVTGFKEVCAWLRIFRTQIPPQEDLSDTVATLAARRDANAEPRKAMTERLMEAMRAETILG